VKKTLPFITLVLGTSLCSSAFSVAPDVATSKDIQVLQNFSITKPYGDEAGIDYKTNKKTIKPISYDNKDSIETKNKSGAENNSDSSLSWKIDNNDGNLLNTIHEYFRHDESFVAPVAVVHNKQIVSSYQNVMLNGSSSYDPGSKTLTYQWKQISGTPVILNNIHAAIAHFTAPVGDNELKFSLTVSNGEFHSPATVTTVKIINQRK